jgi:hypothetical protein
MKLLVCADEGLLKKRDLPHIGLETSATRLADRRSAAQFCVLCWAERALKARSEGMKWLGLR